MGNDSNQLQALQSRLARLRAVELHGDTPHVRAGWLGFAIATAIFIATVALCRIGLRA